LLLSCYATVGPERAKPYEGHFTHHSEL
jgi:hypothetical protein